MTYRIEASGVTMDFEEYEEACKVMAIFISQGYKVSVYGVIEDD